MSNNKKKPVKNESSGMTAVIAVLVALATVIVAIGVFSAIKMVNPDFFKWEKPFKSAYKETNEVTTYVKLSVKDHGDIVMELYPDVAPATVANFQMLVHDKFYDGLTFHRIIQDFMIQGGDPKGNGSGGSPNTIKGEFSANGFTNNLSHTRGVVSMARRGDSMDSASSQFFICNADSTHLDGKYAAFGRVVEGMDTVDSITAVRCGSGDKPLVPVVIEKACFAAKK